MRAETHQKLVTITEEIIAHGKQGTIPLTPDVMRVPASHYTDEARWKKEVDMIFKRVPLMLAMTAELPKRGDYKAMEAVGVPVLIARGDDGVARAFLNSCRHRGAQVAEHGRGNASRFSCPYHAWSYNNEGGLIGVFREREFGVIDKDCHGLIALQTTERAGFIWVSLDPKCSLDPDTFLAGYDQALENFGFKDWYFFDSRVLEGPNWKIAYDGYMDFYHLPILHRNSFGPDMFAQAMYHAWGPHQRVSTPSTALADTPQSEWTGPSMMAGVWTVFPHISIAGFEGGGRGVMISQLFPGKMPAQSFTVQNYLLEREPFGADIDAANAQFKFLEAVVRDEDYATGIKQGISLQTGALQEVLFGRNEGGGQAFHKFVDELIDTPDADLQSFFAGKASC